MREKTVANARKLYIKYNDLIWFCGHCCEHVGSKLLACGKGQ